MNSDTTICTNFLENLWLLILENNECKIETANACEYFVPKKTFDHLWAHEFLAVKCFNDYQPAIEFKCKAAEEASTEIKTEEEAEQSSYRGPEADILPLDQQLALLQQDVDVRKKLAHEFANRQFPWYIQRSTYIQQFQITPDLEKIFKDKFQLEILRNIQRYKCNLMIVDVALAVPLEYMECWLKFAPYACIITAIHDKNLFKKIQNFNNVFNPVLVEESDGCTWQEQLEKSLNTGVKRANELFLYDDASSAIVFVFSQNRGICVCDKFQVLRKS